ncbi:MAG: DUF896 domain-containing protein [Oscillospiraceae bacterium]|nr:DUF896 domain-containing protein [Oscillospiraceae bacterium]
MEKAKIERINYLAKKAKTASLTADELQEQKLLREEYVAEIRNNLRTQLDNTYVVDEAGNKRKLRES